MNAIIIIIEFVLILLLVISVHHFHKKKEEINKSKLSVELDILRLIYADRMEQAYSKDMDEDWFRDAMEILSDGVFSCYG